MPIDIKGLARRGAQLRLAELVAEMDSILEAFPDLAKVPAHPARPTTGRKLSEETRAKMRAAWARRRRTDEEQPGTEMPAAAAPQKKKRTMSTEARARISAAQKKRWRATRAGKKR
jgi:hypothetical protein